MTELPQYIVLFHHFRLFLEQAGRAAIPVVPLKGADLLTRVYPPGEGRGQLADVDFLVPPERFEEACEVLLAQGFREKEAASQEEAHERAFCKTIEGLGVIMFEAHQYLSRFPIDHGAVWERTVASTFDGVPCRRLAPEDAFLYLVLHEVLHRLTDVPRVVADLTMMVRHADLDGDAVIARSREWRLTRAVWLLSSLVVASAPAPGLNRVIDALVPPLPVRMALQVLVPDRTATRVSRLHHRLQALLLWPWLLDSPAQLWYRARTHPAVAGARWCLRRPVEW